MDIQDSQDNRRSDLQLAIALQEEGSTFHASLLSMFTFDNESLASSMPTSLSKKESWLSSRLQRRSLPSTRPRLSTT